MNLARVAGGGDVAGATEDDVDDADGAGDTDDGVKDNSERTFNGTSVTSVGAVDEVDNEVGNDERKGDNGEAEEGIEDGVFGFLKLSRIARGSHVADAADDQEDGGNDAGGADEPIDHIADNVFGRDSGVWSAFESTGVTKKGDMDRV